jgi:hypothetical protein
MEQGGFGGQYETGMSSRGLPNYGISVGLYPFRVSSDIGLRGYHVGISQ